jgi:hypothetical protein
MGDPSLPWIQADPRINAYEKEQKYVLTIYWIFTLVTTVGYGDFVGSTKGEYWLTVLFQFLGVLIFSIMSFLVLQVL